MIGGWSASQGRCATVDLCGSHGYEHEWTSIAIALWCWGELTHVIGPKTRGCWYTPTWQSMAMLMGRRRTNAYYDYSLLPSTTWKPWFSIEAYCPQDFEALHGRGRDLHRREGWGHEVARARIVVFLLFYRCNHLDQLEMYFWVGAISSTPPFLLLDLLLQISSTVQVANLVVELKWFN